MPGETVAGFAVFQHQTFDGDCIGSVSLHDLLHGVMCPHRIHHGFIGDIHNLACHLTERCGFFLQLRAIGNRVEERVEFSRRDGDDFRTQGRFLTLGQFFNRPGDPKQPTLGHHLFGSNSAETAFDFGKVFNRMDVIRAYPKMAFSKMTM